MKIPLGYICFSDSLRDLASNDIHFMKFVVDSLLRHASGDWGSESHANGAALRRYGSIYSIYKTDNAPDILVITDSDRSSTTVKFPDEKFFNTGFKY